MVAGYERLGDKRYLDIAVRSTDFLLTNFEDTVYGGFFERVDADGKVINAGKRTYSHAFALLALSHVARVTKSEKYRIAALHALRDVNLHLRDSSGAVRLYAPP